MLGVAGNLTGSTEYRQLPSHYLEPHWYAAYVSANHEKRVAQQLRLRAIEHFLPLYDSVRRWKDRRINLQLPLFPGYVFVHLALRDRLRVLEAHGVARLVGFNGSPTPMLEQEIDALRMTLREGVRAKPHSYLKAGRQVRVKAGPLKGMQGILVRRKNASRLVISLDLIMRSVAVEVEDLALELCGDHEGRFDKRSND